MFSLDEPTGPHRVGATTFVVPVRPPHVVGNAKLKQQPALLLEEVAFTAYYPARIDDTSKPKKGLNWLLRPAKQSVRGFVHFAKISSWFIWPLVYLFGVFIKIPVYVNAPLLRPSRNPAAPDTDNSPQWPLVIFSHGLGGSRTAYSQLCSNIAASGRVVLAIEHRDGTGHAIMTRSWDSNNKPILKPVLYIRENDIIWDPDTKPNSESSPLPLRAEQLAFRHREVHIAYTSFRQLVEEGHGKHSLETIDGTAIDWASWSVAPDHGPAPVRCERDVTLAGHSFGGCTVFSILSMTPPLKDCTRLPVTKALVLDPWMDPLPAPDPAPFSVILSDSPKTPKDREVPLAPTSQETVTSTVATSAPSTLSGQSLIRNLDGRPELLVINSEPFTRWKEHFTRLQGIVNKWAPNDQPLLTLVRADHTSFSDFFVLPIIRRASARIFLRVIVNLSLAFLDSRLREELKTTKTREMEARVVGVKPNGEPRRRLVGEVGDVIVH